MKQGCICYTEENGWKNRHYSLCASPQSHISPRMGMRDFPYSERLYSTFGGICGYSFRWIRPSASSSLSVLLRVL